MSVRGGGGTGLWLSSPQTQGWGLGPILTRPGLEWRRQPAWRGGFTRRPCPPTQSHCFTPGGSWWHLPAHTKRAGRAWGPPATPHVLGLSFYLEMGHSASEGPSGVVPE